MQKIYSAGNLQEAYLIQGMLNAAGIETRIHNEYAQGGIGEIPFTHAYPEIWLVNETDIYRANQIIKKFETRQQSIADLVCARCHEPNPATFETCWCCGSSLGNH